MKLKKIGVLFFVMTLLQQEAYALNRLDDFGESTVQELLTDCEKFYKEEYQTTPFPKRYSSTTNKQKLYYCMTKLVQTGNFEPEKWYSHAQKLPWQKSYEKEIGPIPDEFYFLSADEAKQFLDEAYSKKQKEDYEKKEWYKKIF